MAYKIIRSVKELKMLSRDTVIECFIALMGGLCRSSKTVYYNSGKKRFFFVNEIDDTEDVLTARELHTKSNIGEAISKGALYLYE